MQPLLLLILSYSVPSFKILFLQGSPFVFFFFYFYNGAFMGPLAIRTPFLTGLFIMESFPLWLLSCSGAFLSHYVISFHGVSFFCPWSHSWLSQYISKSNSCMCNFILSMTMHYHFLSLLFVLPSFATKFRRNETRRHDSISSRNPSKKEKKVKFLGISIITYLHNDTLIPACVISSLYHLVVITGGFHFC